MEEERYSFQVAEHSVLITERYYVQFRHHHRLLTGLYFDQVLAGLLFGLAL